MAQHHIKPPQLEPVAFVFLVLNDSPPLFLQSPVDKSFSFIAQTQGLQVHRPQKGGKGGGSGGVEGLEVHARRRMVSREIREEGTELLAATLV